MAGDDYRQRWADAWPRPDGDPRERAISEALDEQHHSWSAPSEFLEHLAGRGYIVVSTTDLDLVMNHAGDPATVAEYPAAAQRIQDAIGGRRG